MRSPSLRRFLSLVGFLLFLGEPLASAQKAEDRWKMPEADAQKWVLRLKKLCDLVSSGWTVTAKENDFIVQRNQPVQFSQYNINAPLGAPAKRPGHQGAYRLILRFAPGISIDEYERLLAENEANGKKDRELVLKYHVVKRYGEVEPNWGGDVQGYEKEFSKLVFHKLPQFYTPDYSVKVYQSWRWFEFLDSGDKDVDEECNNIREALARYFGTYNNQLAAQKSDVGYDEIDIGKE